VTVKTILLLAWLATASLSGAGTSGSDSGTPAMSVAGAFFALSVPDVRASAKWYAEKLGLSVVMDQPRQAGAAVIVLEGGGLSVELIQHDDASPRPGKASGLESRVLEHGVFKVGVVVADLEQALSTLRRRGVPILLGPYPARGRQKANAIVQDNAGNLIQIFGR
jgi:catechol 2,3-dioxygenase-like lactoylglutathione lyase family enzyme